MCVERENFKKENYYFLITKKNHSAKEKKKTDLKNSLEEFSSRLDQREEKISKLR